MRGISNLAEIKNFAVGAVLKVADFGREKINVIIRAANRYFVQLCPDWLRLGVKDWVSNPPVCNQPPVAILLCGQVNRPAWQAVLASQPFQLGQSGLKFVKPFFIGSGRMAKLDFRLAAKPRRGLDPGLDDPAKCVFTYFVPVNAIPRGQRPRGQLMEIIGAIQSPFVPR